MTAVPRPHTVMALVQDNPGALYRVVGLLRRRGYNITSLTVGPSETKAVSRLTLVVDAENVDQVTKQLNRLLEVLQVQDVTHDPTVERETALVKVYARAAKRARVIALAKARGAKVVDVGTTTVMFELTETPQNIEAFVALVQPVGLKELMRSGRIAMVRGTPSPTTPSTRAWASQADGAGE